MSRLAMGSALTLIAALSARSAPAQTPANAAADPPQSGQARFERGKAFYEAGRLSEACAEFSESQRIAPNTTALLALATCHLDLGKSGSAWSELNEGLARARRESDLDSERYAEAALQELKPRLSTLQVDVPPALARVPELQLRLDGQELPASRWDTPLPLDPGPHYLDAAAPLRQPWHRDVQLSLERDVLRVSIELAPEPRHATFVAGSSARSTRPDVDSGWSGGEWAGLALLGFGAASLGVATYQYARGLARSGREQDALDYRNRAIAWGVAGALLGGAGTTLLVLGRSKRLDAQASTLALSVGFPSAARWSIALNGKF